MGERDKIKGKIKSGRLRSSVDVTHVKIWSIPYSVNVDSNSSLVNA